MELSDEILLLVYLLRNKFKGLIVWFFFAGTLSNPREIEVRCYAPDGEFLTQHSNTSLGIVFMGFKSKRKIGWIEIEAITPDATFAMDA